MEEENFQQMIQDLERQGWYNRDWQIAKFKHSHKIYLASYQLCDTVAEQIQRFAIKHGAQYTRMDNNMCSLSI
jgi:hypothetical protein